MVLAFVGIVFCAQTQIFAAENVDANLAQEVATLRADIEELKILVSGLKTELSARRSEIADLEQQIQQEQNTLADLRSQVAQEQQTLAMLQTGGTTLLHELSTKWSELADLEQQIQQEQNTLTDLRSQVAQERQTLAVLKTGGRTLLQTIYFAPDSSKVDAYYIPHLNKIGRQMANTPNMKIVVRGFSNKAGTTEGMLRISRERAEQTAQFLQRNYGITADRITVEWVGADELPIAPNVNITDKTRRAAQVFILE
jgi:outer membrane protein OmpA-like peptidoglycan-associated protein